MIQKNSFECPASVEYNMIEINGFSDGENKRSIIYALGRCLFRIGYRFCVPACMKDNLALLFYRIEGRNKNKR